MGVGENAKGIVELKKQAEAPAAEYVENKHGVQAVDPKDAVYVFSVHGAHCREATVVE